MIDNLSAKNIFDSIFDDINGFDISIQNRKALHVTDSSYTYGEITFESFKIILDSASKKEGVFMDLGSGTGKALVAASLIGNYEKIIGIEALKNLCDTSQKIIDTYVKTVNKDMCKNIQVINNDFTREDISYADIIYTASTCFDQNLMDSLSKKCDGLKHGSIFITLTKPLTSEHMLLKQKLVLPMTWGNTTVFIFVRS